MGDPGGGQDSAKRLPGRFLPIFFQVKRHVFLEPDQPGTQVLTAWSLPAYLLENLYTVFVRYSSPGLNTVDGNPGWLGESG